MNGFYPQITQATINLVTRYLPIFLNDGLAMFRIIAVIFVIWQGYKVAFHQHPVDKMAILLVHVALVYGVLVYYSAPIPGIGKNVTQVVTDSAADLAQSMDTTMTEQVTQSIATMTTNVGGAGWSVVINPGAEIRAYILLFCLTAVQVFVLGVIAFGFVATGVLVLLGPVLIPFFLVPGLDWIATGWFRSLIQYSFYPVVGAAFVFVYGTIWMNYLGQANGPLDSATIAAYVWQFATIMIAGVFGILKIPQLVAGIFSGSSAGSAFPGYRWWR